MDIFDKTDNNIINSADNPPETNSTPHAALEEASVQALFEQAKALSSGGEDAEKRLAEQAALMPDEVLPVQEPPTQVMSAIRPETPQNLPQAQKSRENTPPFKWSVVSNNTLLAGEADALPFDQATSRINLPEEQKQKGISADKEIEAGPLGAIFTPAASDTADAVWVPKAEPETKKTEQAEEAEDTRTSLALPPTEPFDETASTKEEIIAEENKPAILDDDNSAATKVQATVDKTKSKKKGDMARKKKTVGKTTLKNLLSALVVTICLSVVVVCFLAVQLSLYLVDVTKDDDMTLNLENVRGNQGQNSTILGVNPELGILPIDKADVSTEVESNWVEGQILHGDEKREWVPLDRVPQDVVNGFLAIEDRIFHEHHGVNWGRTFYAFANRIFKFKDFEFGASTLHQQLIKNLTGDSDVDSMRKVREIYRALVMDKNYSKEMILEAYLNTVGLSENLVGVQAGAQDYFGKDVVDLTLAESALIAGITQQPTEYSPHQNPENSLKRRNHVLGKMLDENFITTEQYNDAIAQPLGVLPKAVETDDNLSLLNNTRYSFYTDTVIAQVIEDLQEQRGMTKSEAIKKVFSGGLRIYTPIDIEMQAILDDMFLNGEEEDGWFASRINSTGLSYMQTMGYTTEDPLLDADGNPVLDEEGEPVMKVVYPEAAMVIMGYDGSIQAIAGGIGSKEENRGLNRATQSFRQTGSTMKPIAAYSLGIDNGIITYSTGIYDKGIDMQATPVLTDPETGERILNWPQNINNPPYKNIPIPVVSAISQSFNTVAAAVGEKVGAEVMFDFLRNTLQVDSIVGPEEAHLHEGNTDIGIGPLALGMLTEGMSPLDVAASYQMFGNGGVYFPPKSYFKVVDYMGNVLLDANDLGTQAISQDSAFIMNRMLYTVLRSGAAPGVWATAAGKALPYLDSVAKTGSTDDWRDRWFVGLTPYYVSAVWWGYDLDQPSRTNPVNLKPWRTDGGNIPVNIWYDVMVKVQEGMPQASFPGATDTIVELPFCVSSGMLAGSGCPDTRVGYYSEEHPLPNVCYDHNAAPE